MPALYYGKAGATLSFPDRQLEISFCPKEALRPVSFKTREALYRDPESIKVGDPIEQGCVLVIPGEVKTKHYEAWKAKAVDPSIELAEVKQVGDSFLATPYRGDFRGFKGTRTD
jgi:hypothetical protein